MTIIVLDGQGGGIGRAIIAALSPGCTGAACSCWWKTPPDKRRGSPPRRKALALLHNLWLDAAFTLPYNGKDSMKEVDPRDC